jgi:hypothetical protein
MNMRLTKLVVPAIVVSIFALVVVSAANTRWSVGQVGTAVMQEQATRRGDPLLMFRASLVPAVPESERTIKREVYVPAYSSVRAKAGRSRIDLARTLSIQNTSRDHPLVLERIDYHSTEGGLIQAFLPQPVALKPLGTMEVFLPEDDTRGGTGANFVVAWAAAGPVPEPVIEAVMLGTSGNTNYSFVSQGRSMQPVALDPVLSR